MMMQRRNGRAGNGGAKGILLSFIVTLSLGAAAQVTAEPTGWILFDDSIATVLELRDAQLERLREIDRRYQLDYQQLGDAPRSNPNYLALTERRNAEVQIVMDGRQFEQWMRINDYDYEIGRRRAEPGPQSTEMDRRNPQGNQFQQDSRSNVNDRPTTPKVGDGAGGIGTTP
jgi:hypothetical protein